MCCEKRPAFGWDVAFRAHAPQNFESQSNAVSSAAVNATSLTVYWITGASSGIGAALARQLALPGNALVLSGRNEKALQDLASELATIPVAIHPFDVAETSKAPDFVAQAIAFFGHVDVLVNNAGFSQRSQVMDTLPEVERRIMEVNYFAPVALSKAILPHFVARKKGHIVVVSSIAGIFGFKLRSSYAAAKHALHGYFEALRLEMHEVPVYVTIVCPGRVNTAISYHALKADGTAHNTLDEGQRKGISAERCARLMIRAIQRRRKEIWIGKAELIPAYLKHYCPPVFYWLIQKVKAT